VALSTKNQNRKTKKTDILFTDLLRFRAESGFSNFEKKTKDFCFADLVR